HRDTPIRDEHGTIVAIHGIGRDVTDRRRAESEQKLFADLGIIFAGTLDVDETLTGVARTVVGMFADCCVVDLFAAEGRARMVKVVHADASRLGTAQAIERSLTEQPRSQVREPSPQDTRRVLLSDFARSEQDLPETIAAHVALLNELGPI